VLLFGALDETEKLLMFDTRAMRCVEVKKYDLPLQTGHSVSLESEKKISSVLHLHFVALSCCLELLNTMSRLVGFCEIDHWRVPHIMRIAFVMAIG
jgi:hypothetical protein